MARSVLYVVNGQIRVDPYQALVNRYLRGKDLSEVEELLRSDKPIPEHVRRFLADILTEKIQKKVGSKRGPKPKRRREKEFNIWLDMTIWTICYGRQNAYRRAEKKYHLSHGSIRKIFYKWEKFSS